MTISPPVSKPRGTRRWVSKIRARNPLGADQREVKVVERNDLGLKGVRVREGRSRLRVTCMVVMCKMYLRAFADGQADFANYGWLKPQRRSDGPVSKCSKRQDVGKT